MTADPHDDGPPETAATGPVREQTLWSRIPRHLFGGRMRTTTAALIMLFIITLAFYSQRAAHYAALDEASHTTVPSISHTDAPVGDDTVTTPPDTFSVTPTATPEVPVATSTVPSSEAPASETESPIPSTSTPTTDAPTPSTHVVPTTSPGSR